MKEKKVSVLAYVKAKAGFEERVREACLALVAPSRAEEGCLNYDLHQSIENIGRFMFYENWMSKERLERHLERPHSLAFDERTEGMLEEAEEVTFWEMIS
jgi:quinol monooxygenase YgiN